jgi:hypothetical protein
VKPIVVRQVNFEPDGHVYLIRRRRMLTFLIWVVVLIFCWPLALLALVLYPIVWLILLPFRIVGIAVGGVLSLFTAIITLPARLVRRIA